MVRWPAVSAIALDGTVTTRLFPTMEDAKKWLEAQQIDSLDRKWIYDEVDTIQGRRLFSIHRTTTSEFSDVLRKMILFYFGRVSDTFAVRDWGLSRVEPLQLFGHIGPTDSHGLVQVIGTVTPGVLEELIKRDWFEVILWQGDTCLLYLDDQTDVSFLLNQAQLDELKSFGVFPWMLWPEGVGSHDEAPRLEVPRPQVHQKEP